MTQEKWERFETTETPLVLDCIRVIINTDEYATNNQRVEVLKGLVTELYQSDNMNSHKQFLERLVHIIEKRREQELDITVKKRIKAEPKELPIFEKLHNEEPDGKLVHFNEIEMEMNYAVKAIVYEITINIKKKVF